MSGYDKVYDESVSTPNFLEGDLLRRSAGLGKAQRRSSSAPPRRRSAPNSRSPHKRVADRLGAAAEVILQECLGYVKKASTANSSGRKRRPPTAAALLALLRQRPFNPGTSSAPVGDREVFEGVADRLVAAAEVLGQERLGHGVERQAVLRPGEAVAFVGDTARRSPGSSSPASP